MHSKYCTSEKFQLIKFKFLVIIFNFTSFFVLKKIKEGTMKHNTYQRCSGKIISNNSPKKEALFFLIEIDFSL